MRTKVLLTLFLLTPVIISGYNQANGHLQGRVTYRPEIQAERYFQAEEELQTAYGVLRRTLEPVAEKKLDVAQRAWERFKVAECDFKINHSAESPLHPMSYNECLMSMNRERTVDLEAEIQWQFMTNPDLSMDARTDVHLGR